MSAPELLPCPFCEGGKPEDLRLIGSGKWCVTCEGCSCQGPYVGSPAEAERLWNRRAGTALLREALDEAERQMDQWVPGHKMPNGRTTITTADALALVRRALVLIGDREAHEGQHPPAKRRGRKRLVDPETAERVRDLYRTTSCSMSRVSRHFNISLATASQIIDYRGAYAEDRPTTPEDEQT